MRCRNHADREAKHFCTVCGVPLCKDCVEETRPGTYHCFQCAMLTSVSEGGSQIQDRREKIVHEKLKERRKWGPFRYFLIVSAVLIAVMWGVIFFGGEKAPAGSANIAENPRAFLFMVDSALKRYAHYEKAGYPERLTDLVPKYLRVGKGSVDQLRLFSYQKDPNEGYVLSLAKKAPGEKTVVISAKGVQYISEGGGV
jgi:hypothetical protein